MIKRADGTVVGGAPKQFTGIRTVHIADLVPLEGAVVKSAVEAYRKKIAAGEAVERPKAVQLGTETLIRDGNNRIYAAILEGKDDVEVEYTSSGANLAFHQGELKFALQRDRKGFKNMTEVASDEEREKFTVHEAEENNSNDWLADLAKK